MEIKNKEKLQIGVFIDRDGTINEEVGYLNHIDRLWLLPKSTKAIKMLNDKGLRVIIITNQSGVAKGYFPENLVKEVNKKLIQLLNDEGASIDAIYYCPHHPEKGIEKYRRNCDCRKPNIGMLKMAEMELNVELNRSYIVGDRISDIIMAHRTGAKGILVLTGYGKGELEFGREKWKEFPDYIAEDLYDAVLWIFKEIDLK